MRKKYVTIKDSWMDEYIAIANAIGKVEGIQVKTVRFCSGRVHNELEINRKYIVFLGGESQGKDIAIDLIKQFNGNSRDLETKRWKSVIEKYDHKPVKQVQVSHGAGLERLYFYRTI